ncbi:P-loop containing nucleoside triphosphate hydrolase protein [Mycena crocata]|nr:P-loop containing nucleoside triphosphate hydrolase protein [Mycena crocata]
MPQQLTPNQLRLNTALACLTGAVTTMEVLSASLNAPFLEAISNTVRSLLTAMQTIKRNKIDCTHLMEQTYTLLYAIASLCIKSEAGADLPLSTLNHLGKALETLHKVHGFVDAQHDKNRIKIFFNQGEMNKLLKDCKAGLEQLLDAFKVHDMNLLMDISEMQKYTEDQHQEVRQLIEDLADDRRSDTTSLRNGSFYESHNSSTSISLLPSEPKIFYGRQLEMLHILKLFTPQAPRIVILGPGGMGKTSLARAVLHHSEITAQYDQHRFFVPCDLASTHLELAAQIGAHLGLKHGKDLTKAVVRYFCSSPASLLILDNFETIWEPTNTRRDVEEFLSLLTDVSHLALIVTMRGAERPGNVRWTRPFLEPLKPLADDAARQTFVEIADNLHNSSDVDKVLLLTANMPLAIDLIAHLVDSEGCPSVLFRWEQEKTALISTGYDKRSNLDLSISLSLSSPRITSLPHSQELLALLAILPDGISDSELMQSKLPIENILGCKAALLSTSLAYINDQARIQTLVPIREYMQNFCPPRVSIIQPLLVYYQDLLDIHRRYPGTVSESKLVTQLQSNFANIGNILRHGIQHENPESAIYGVIHLNQFSRRIGSGWITLMDEIPNALQQLKSIHLAMLRP